MTYDGDVKLYPSADGGDIAFEAGQPYMDAGLETAAYISLFTAVYWGNAIAAESEKTSSQIETLFRRVLDNRARLDAIEYAKAALAWMKTDGVASEIAVDASIPQPNRLQLVVMITEPTGAETTLKYALNWQAQLVAQEVSS
jgi:phage gp46-like protein